MVHLSYCDRARHRPRRGAALEPAVDRGFQGPDVAGRLPARASDERRVEIAGARCSLRRKCCRRHYAGCGANDAERFPAFDARRLVLIENGYDEESFRRAELAQADARMVGSRPEDRPVRLLHSGIVYRSERDPSQLFAAVAELKRGGRLTRDDLQMVFRACGDESGYRRDLAALEIEDIVRLESPLGYLDALEEMSRRTVCSSCRPLTATLRCRPNSTSTFARRG